MTTRNTATCEIAGAHTPLRRRARRHWIGSLLGLLFIAGSGNAQDLSIRPLIGGFPADAGFALGGAVSRTRFAGPVEVQARGILSVKKYQLYEVGAGVPELGRWFSFGITGRYRNFPEEDYWGLGPNTPKSARMNYLMEDVDTTATLSVRANGFHGGVRGGFLKVNTGPGRDEEYPPVPEPLQSSPSFGHIGAFAEYQSLDEEANPHSGGKYSFEVTSYRSSFQRYTVDLRRFIPVSATDRIGLRLQTLFTRSSSETDVPFFMLPIVGGTDTVRGFTQYRFRDRNALILNSEYRRPLGGFLDLVVFADTGRVFANTKDLGLRDLHHSAGAGVRLKFGTRLFFGIDLGFSNEGAKLWFRSSQMF